MNTRCQVCAQQKSARAVARCSATCTYVMLERPVAYMAAGVSQ
jgi:hypothetical protein